MTNEIKQQLHLREKLGSFKHPNMHIELYPPDTRLADLKRATIFEPLSPKSFVLCKVHIHNGVSIFTETTELLFLYHYLFITSSMGLNFWSRSDGSLDATASTCKLLYQKTGLKGFELKFNELTSEQQIVLQLNDGNSFHSVGINSAKKISMDCITLLNEALTINKWL
jgi:hypothetical protein